MQRIDDGWRNLAFIHHQDFPVMHGFSPLILGKPADWGRWVHVSGFWVTPMLGLQILKTPLYCDMVT